jgi:hypothetical protein
MAAFQDHFCRADLDQLSTATTGLASYHGATNHIASTPNLPIHQVAEQAASKAKANANAKIIADTVRTQVEQALAAMNINNHGNNNGGNNSGYSNGSNNTDNRHTKSYCWTHGTTQNLCHNSQTCNFRADGNKENATTCDKMGSSTRICGARNS